MTNLMSERARRMRGDKEPAEHKLWYLLREFNRHGSQFRQQAPIGPYIADFCDHTAKLIIEVDGSQHGDGTDEPQSSRLTPSPMERLQKKARQLARLRTPRKARSTRHSAQGSDRRVPSPFVGEGQGGGESQASDVGVPPTPSPSPRHVEDMPSAWWGGETVHSELRGLETHNG